MTRGLHWLRSVCCWLCAGLASLFLAQSAHTHPVTRANLGEESVGVYLNPNTGRFWTMDSYEGNSQDPQSLHKYLYAHNNPVNMVDPSGHDGFSLSGLLVNTAIRAGLYTLTGAAIGGAARGGDALIDGRPIWQETVAGAKWGAAVGFSSTFRFLRPVLGVAGAALGGYSTGHALSEEKYGLALYRGVLTAGGIYGYYIFNTPKGSINVTTGIRGSKGTIYFGGYDPKARSVHLGDDGHFGGMKGAGGTPEPGTTPGITVLETAEGVQWANDSLSLPKALAADEAAAVQAILESFFTGQTVKQVPVIK